MGEEVLCCILGWMNIVRLAHSNRYAAIEPPITKLEPDPKQVCKQVDYKGARTLAKFLGCAGNR